MRYLILDNIRSAYNVGSIFRTADGAGISKIFLAGTTPAPIDRFGREVAEIVKTSLGASSYVPWEYVPDTMTAVKEMQKSNVQIIAVEQHRRSIPIYETKPSDNVCYIFGNEINGVDKEICEIADMVMDVPMYGQKESLNVSVTVGIVLFQYGPY